MTKLSCPTHVARQIVRFALSALVALPLGFAADAFAQQPTPFFTPGNLVVLVEGCGVSGGTCTSVPNGLGTGGGYGDNQAGPVTLFQFKPTGAASASYVNSLVLPQTGSGANLPIAGEYGSSSEGGLQLSGQGQYLTFGTYGINAAVFNANPVAYGAAPSNALAQSGSLTGQSYTPIGRVVTLVDAYGNVNSSTPVFNIFNTNNPRSVYSADGTTAYMSGQGSGADATSGVFFTPLGSVNNAPTAITGLDTTKGTVSQDTRFLTVYNGTLYVSTDTKGGSNNARSFLGTLGTPPATTLFNGGAGPTQLVSSNNAASPTTLTSTSKIILTPSETNTINAGMTTSKETFNLSPSGFFFANAYTLYVADTGNPKQNAATNLYGDGGLQKWINTAPDGSGTWVLQYTMSQGLNLVANPSALPSSTSGTTGLYGLTGVVSGSTVYLYATNATIGDLDQTYLYGIADSIAATTNPGTPFTLLATAPADSNFKGVSFAPILPAGSATINTAPSGLTVTTAGTGCAPGTYVTPVTLVWTPGSSCSLTTATPQTVGGTSYVLTQWQDGTTNPTDMVIAPTGSATYTATFSSTYQPVGSLDKAVDNTTTSSNVLVGDSLLVSGWAADPADGSPLGNVKVYVDGNLFGTPMLGISRPDVAAANHNAAYTNSGFQLVAPVTALSLGTHAVTVIAVDAAGHSATLGPLSINVVATPVVTVNSGSLVVGTATTTLTAKVAYTGSVAPTGSVSFTVNGSTSGVGTATCSGNVSPLTCTASYASSTLAVGSYPVVATVAANSSFGSATGTGTLTVIPIPVVTVASGSVVLGTAATTLTATVAYTGTAAPTGGLSFTVNGSATGVGTVACAGSSSPLTCTASYAPSALLTGSYPIVATLAASTGFGGAMGTGTLTVTTAPDFGFTSSGTSSQTVKQGGAATFSFTLNPTSATYPGPVMMSVSGLPAGATATFSPSTFVPAGAPQVVTLTVQTAAATSENRMLELLGGRSSLALAGLLLLPLGFRRRLRAGMAGKLLLLVLFCGSLAGLTGCGGSSPATATTTTTTTNPATSTLMVTATSGTVKHTTAVTLIVQ